jgi:hypothetical protein
MYEIKNNTTSYLPVRFFDQNGLPLSGVSYTTVTATVLRSDNTSTIVSPASSADFFEITFGDFAGAGVYFLRVQGPSLAVNGVASYAVSSSVVGAKKHVGVLNVVAQVENDTYSRIGAPAGASVSADVAALKAVADTVSTKVGTPAGASVSADVAAVKAVADTVNTTTGTINTKLGTPAGASLSADVAAVKSVADTLKQIETGRWKYFKTGPNANKMILYAVDGSTPLFTFSMLDETGTPTSTSPFERVPVP